jgi:transposase
VIGILLPKEPACLRSLRIFCQILIDIKANDCHTIGFFFGVNAKELLRKYKKHLSNFTTWERGEHANTWLLFPENMGQYFFIDEVNLSMGELYTVVTNKEAKGKRSYSSYCCSN